MNVFKIRKIINILLIIMVTGAWIGMTFFGSDGALSAGDFSNLRYFTVLSNMLEGIASVIWLITAGRSDTHAGTETSGRSETSGGTGISLARAERLKYIAVAALLLTFLTIMVFLGPLYGYVGMLSGANLWFHLFIPVLAAVEMLFFCDCEFTLRDNNLVVIPPLVYGIAYLLNIQINGLGEWPDTNDWYLFLHWGYGVGFIIFFCICLVTWLSAFAICKFKRRPPRS